jgi:hypothetical protein
MLSIHECKKILKANDVSITDEEVKRIMEFLYFLATIQITNIKNKIQ